MKFATTLVSAKYDILKKKNDIASFRAVLEQSAKVAESNLSEILFLKLIASTNTHFHLV